MIIARLRASAFMICAKVILRLLMILIVCTGAEHHDGWFLSLFFLGGGGIRLFFRPIRPL